MRVHGWEEIVGKERQTPSTKKTSYLEFKDFLSAAQNNDPSTVGRGIIATDPETKMYFPDPPLSPISTLTMFPATWGSRKKNLSLVPTLKWGKGAPGENQMSLKCVAIIPPPTVVRATCPLLNWPLFSK